VPTSHQDGDARHDGEQSPPKHSPPVAPSDLRVALPERLVAATRDGWRAKLGEHAHAAIDSAVRQGCVEMALDMRATTELDASGLGFLVAVRQRAFDRGLAVRLVGVAPPIRALLAATRLEGLFVADE